MLQCEQVLERRYKKIISEDLVKPDIILIDGGQAQLNVSNRYNGRIRYL